MTDRTTKALLLAIALGLWVNVAGQWLRPEAVSAQGLPDIWSEVLSIQSDVSAIAGGLCLNSKIC